MTQPAPIDPPVVEPSTEDPNPGERIPSSEEPTPRPPSHGPNVEQPIEKPKEQPEIVEIPANKPDIGIPGAIEPDPKRPPLPGDDPRIFGWSIAM